MKSISVIFLLFLSSGIMAQNSSFGIGISSMNLEDENGLYLTGNVRTQFTNIFGWQTEVGYASVNGKTTFIEVEEISSFNITRTNTIIVETSTRAMSLKTALTAKIFDTGGLSGEAIIGGGLYRNDRDIYGLLSGEFFLSARIGKNLVAGIPLSYNFITWAREDFITAGVSLRFHM